ncbi:MAG: PTS sugar transporter subunit IIA [Erysipelotrichaceae bacterium]|nr:PTS sugar transporter subunit IIA [Erysipelotrichaceae bacterium]
MKGIILLSHGPMAQGMFETTKWFMGDDIPQYEYLCLNFDTVIETYDEQLKALVEKVDTGEGVIIFTDLLGGTPFNRCVPLVSETVDVFAGMNLTIVLEQLARRIGNNYDFDSLLEISRQGLSHMRKPTVLDTDDDDFLD